VKYYDSNIDQLYVLLCSMVSRAVSSSVAVQNTEAEHKSVKRSVGCPLRNKPVDADNNLGGSLFTTDSHITFIQFQI
jgi:hypothetical protein